MKVEGNRGCFIHPGHAVGKEVAGQGPSVSARQRRQCGEWLEQGLSPVGDTALTSPHQGAVA